MHDAPSLSRRRFTARAALALLGGASISLSGCGGGSSPTSADPTPNLGPGDKAASVGTNHGHTAVITAAQLAASGALTLQIRGSSDHPHTVALSAADVAAIAAGTRVSRVSSNDDAHTHSVTFN
jgi:hypothetical protein